MRRTLSHFSWIAASFLFILLATGCTSFSKAEQPVITDFHSLNSTTSIGQTGLSRYNGLQSISLFLKPEIAGEGTIRLLLLDSPVSNQRLAQATLNSNSLTSPGYYTFSFLPVTRSTMRDIYILIEYTGSGSIQVGIAPGNMYLNGALYVDHIPQDAQLSFLSEYHTFTAALGLLQEGIQWVLLLIAAIFLFILPGWALLSATWSEWNALPGMVKIGLSAGVSLPVYPLIMVWTDLIGLHLGAWYAWLPPVIAAVVLLWKSKHFFKLKPKFLSDLRESIASPSHFDQHTWSNLVYVLVLSLIIFVRFWVIRSLEIPLWGDSYQHTVISQLLIDNKGLFTSWQPYAEMVTLSYHFGFHSLSAVFHWLTGLTAPLSTLWVGQILNILAVTSLVPLACKLGKNRWAGVAALLLAGTLFQMPNFYLNWGRYPQLAGLVILVSLAWLLLDWLGNLKPQRAAALSLCVILAGLAMTHYRAIVMAILFLLAYWFLFLKKSSASQLFMRSMTLGAVSFILFLPWFSRAFYSDLILWLQNKLSVQAQQSPDTAIQFNALGDLGAFLPAIFWLVFFLVIAWGLWKREKNSALISLWWLLILIAANPHWLSLPSEDILDTFSVLIAAYIPASILIGAAIGWAVSGVSDYFQSRQATSSHPINKAMLVILLITLIFATGIKGSRDRLFDIQYPVFTLVTKPDLRAAEWIKHHTPASSKFLVNSFFAYDNNLIVGSDAGWWLPLTANRQTTLPPLTYGVEKGPDEQYRAWVNELSAIILEKGISHPEVLQELVEREIDYLYIGQQQGLVNTEKPLLKLDQLLADAHFEVAYHQDRVWIFKFLGAEEVPDEN